MIRSLAIVGALVIGASSLVTLLAAFIAVRDARRLRRARTAALTARERLDLERKLAASRESIPVRVELLAVGTGAVRWIAWDDDPQFDEQVDGVLVPYAAGTAATRIEAEDDARVAVLRRLDGRGRVVRVQAVNAESDGPS